MTYSELRKMIEDHNWDDGFGVPANVLEYPDCDLALALEIFYLGDGYSYLISNKSDDGRNQSWVSFIGDLYHRIKDGSFERTTNSFKIPLNTAQIYKLRKSGVPEVFLEY